MTAHLERHMSIQRNRFFIHLLAAAAINLIILPHAAAQIRNPDNGHYYEHVAVTISWDDAKIAAENRYYLGARGHLATITSAAESAFVASNFPSYAFIGGFQQPGTAEPHGGWQWVTGEPWAYTNWYPGEPSDTILNFGEDRLQIYPAIGGHPAGLWNDITGVPSAIGYLVEYEPSGLPAPTNLLVAGLGSHNVLRYDGTTGAFIDTFIPPGSGGLSLPRGIAIGSDGNVYVSSIGAGGVLRYSGTTGAFIDFFASVPDPRGLVFGPDGNLYVNAGGFDEHIRRFSGTTGAFIDVFVPPGSGGFDGGNDLVFGADGNLYTTNIGHGVLGNDHSVLRYDGASGAFIDAFVGPASGGLNQPAGITFGPDGNLYVAKNHPNSSILRYDGVTGAFIDTFVSPASGGLDQPFSIAFGPDGNLYVASLGTNQVLRYDGTSGAFLDVFANTAANGLSLPWGLVFTPPSNQAPTANAGADLTGECSLPAGTPVTLDGSGSSDPDGDMLTYRWTGPFPEGGGVVYGISPTVTLPLGASTITLVVNDGSLDSAPDTLVVTVTVRPEGLLPPLAALVQLGDPVPLPERAFNQGRTVPLRLRLFCGATPLTDQDVAPPTLVDLRRAGDPINLGTIDPDPGEANDSGLRFRFSEGNWVYNLSTRDLIAGTYEVRIELPDGRVFAAAFVLR